MNEDIPLSHICVSPHRVPYEAFLQLDPLKKSRDLDPDSGIFGLISTAFPIAHGDATISLQSLRRRLPSLLEDPDDLETYRRKLDDLEWRCRSRGETLRMAVYMSLAVQKTNPAEIEGYHTQPYDSTSEETILLGYFPLFTNRDTFIIDGLERVPILQMLPSPGLHLHQEGTENRTWVATVRPVWGPFFEMSSGSSSGKARPVSILVGKHRCGLGLFLRHRGLFEKVADLLKKAGLDLPIEEDGGEDFQYFLNNKIDKNADMMFEGMNGYYLGSPARKNLNERLANAYSTMDIEPPESDARLTAEDIAAIYLFLQHANASRTARPDDPVDLLKKQILLISDHVQERVTLLLTRFRRNVIACLQLGADPLTLPLNFPLKWRSKVLDDFFKGELCPIISDANPLSELSLKRKITPFGPRGIRNTHGNMERRGVHASHYGRICLAETPESEKIGFNLHLALAARVENGTIKAPYLDKDNPDGAKWLTVDEEKQQTIAPGGWDAWPEPDGRFLVRRGQDTVAAGNVADFTLVDSYRGQFLGIGANLIPFVQHDDNNRVMMGAKNMKQALPLLRPEAPLIRTGREALAARLSGHALYAGNAGVVESVRAFEIVVKAGEREDETDNYRLDPLRPTAAGTVRLHKPLVKPGDRVLKDQVLADGTCTVNGELSLGVNLLCAYMPWHGLNFEDGIVISDRLVREDVLTSLHLHEVKFDVYGDERMESKEHTAKMKPFSKDGGVLCWKGKHVSRGDRLFGKYTKTGKKIDIKWLHSPAAGEVIDIRRVDVNPNSESPSHIRCRSLCYIREERKVCVGDKLMGRHGNKGVISRIVPEADMPRLHDGTAVDIVLNPHGVISRMNLGQILETHLGWIVRHGGEKYEHFRTVAPFECIVEADIQKAFRELYMTGINEEGKAVLVEGKTGMPIENPVTVGYQYIMKLNHLAQDKINTRETGPYTLLTGQPAKGKKHIGGQRVGEMEGWALQAHTAWNILHEFMTLKADAVHLRKRDPAQAWFGLQSPIHGLVPFQKTLRATVMLLRGLCFDVTLYDSRGEVIPLHSEWLTDLDSIQIRLADEETIRNWAGQKEVTKPATVKKGKIKYVQQGLIDPAVFEDAGTDMGFVPLCEPVIHPLFFVSLWKVVMESNSSETPLSPLSELLDGNSVEAIQKAVLFKAAVVGGPDFPNKKVCYPSNFEQLSRECTFEAGPLLLRSLLPDMANNPLQNALLTAIPVLPRDFRPLWATHGEIHVKSKLNDLYREILKANQRLKQELDRKEPAGQDLLFVLRARLQQSVNRLMVGDDWTERAGSKSIGERIKGKEGIFRMHHLGKRVDVSARAVIVPQPELSLDQVGIPLEMAAGLMKSRLLATLAEKCNGATPEEKMDAAREIYRDQAHYREMIQKVLFDPDTGLLRDTWVILTRAPSLHKYNMLAFRPVPVLHQSIGLHPLACKFFNADFDGDQMGVFVPLSKEAQEEARTKLSPMQNLFSVAGGNGMLNFSQDVALGIYVLTATKSGRKTFNAWFEKAGLDPVSGPVNGKALARRVKSFHWAVKDAAETARLAQTIMTEGFRQATLYGLTFSIFDVPFLPREERDREKEWNPLDRQVEDTSVTLMVRSGARGDDKQIRQLGAFRGLLKDIKNEKLSPPVMRNFREGISPLEYYIGSHGARRSMCEKKLATAPAGDFTRLMVEAAYKWTIKGDDCGTKSGVTVYPFPEGMEEFNELPGFQDRLVGRVKMDGTVIGEKEARELAEAGQPVRVRSVLTCEAQRKWGDGALCGKCYGWDLSTRDFPIVGFPAGIVAGESIGERGTQLTMQTFHTGGVGGGGVTEGLPRMKTLFSNGILNLREYQVLDPGETPLEQDAWVPEWEYILAATRTRGVGPTKHDVPFSDAPGREVRFGGILSKNDLDTLRIILVYEAQRMYKGAVDEKHFEVIVKSMLRIDENGEMNLRGIRSVPLDQPGFLAAASFQRSLEVLAGAALKEMKDDLKGNKARLITGKKMGEEC